MLNYYEYIPIDENDDYAIINKNTGEIVTDLDNCSSLKLERNTDLIKGYNQNKKFVKLFDGTDELHRIINNDGIFSTCLRLSKFICYEDCILRKGGHRNGQMLSVQDISQLLDIPYSTLRKHFAVLIRLGIVINNKVGKKQNTDPKLAKFDNAILVNPDVYMRGCNIDKTVLRLFENTGWADNKPKDIAEKSPDEND